MKPTAQYRRGSQVSGSSADPDGANIGVGAGRKRDEDAFSSLVDLDPPEVEAGADVGAAGADLMKGVGAVATGSLAAGVLVFEIFRFDCRASYAQGWRGT